MFKVDLPPDTGPMYTYTTCCECEQLRARIAELETERDAARIERNEYFSERNKACERASALTVERDALKAELSDCKADLAAYEAQRPDDNTFSFLAASYDRKISQLEAERDDFKEKHNIALNEFYDLAALYSPLVVEHERTKAELDAIRQARREAYRQEGD